MRDLQFFNKHFCVSRFINTHVHFSFSNNASLKSSLLKLIDSAYITRKNSKHLSRVHIPQIFKSENTLAQGIIQGAIRL